MSYNQISGPIFTHYLQDISIKSLRNYILDAGISDSDTILLNTYDFDKIVLDYRNTYSEGITLPYLLLGVLIKEDDSDSVPENRIKVIQNDIESLRAVEDDQPNFDEPIYRCGYCGNIVERDGHEMSDQMRDYNIGILQKFPYKVDVRHVHGSCCERMR